VLELALGKDELAEVKLGLAKKRKDKDAAAKEAPQPSA